MSHIGAFTTGNVTTQLSQLIGLELAHIQVEDQVEGAPATVQIVYVVDRRQTEYRLVLKEQEDRDAFCLYTHYLKPFDLNSPHYYRYIDVDGRLFLVMEYVRHAAPNWRDPHGLLQAVDWLIKADPRSRV